MSASIFHNNAVFKGELKMFDQTFSYDFEILEVGVGNFRFKHKISVEAMNMTIDQKEGEGVWEKLDENVVKIRYNDPETNFEGDVNVNTMKIMGTAKQANGLFTGSPGTFELYYMAK
jgi:hypothetical protein